MFAIWISSFLSIVISVFVFALFSRIAPKISYKVNLTDAPDYTAPGPISLSQMPLQSTRSPADTTDLWHDTNYTRNH
jgi:hypothetical protein